jgi:hypothetical protein
MREPPLRADRPSARVTTHVLTAGTLASVALFLVGFVLHLAGQTGVGDLVSTAAVGALLATPAAGLVATAVELRRPQPSAATLAVLVLLILGAATALALAGLR